MIINNIYKKKFTIRIFDLIGIGVLGFIIILLILTQNNSTISQYDGKNDDILVHLSSRNNKKVIVFVHGIGGNIEDTWRKSVNDERFPDLVFKDPKLKEFDVFVPTYYTSESSEKNSNIFELAQNLNAVLENQGVFSNEKTGSKYNEVYFVTHSMGNIVTRTALTLRNSQQKHAIVPLIISFASPSSGSQLADLSNQISDHPQLEDMALLEKNSFLSLLNQIWLSKPYDTEIACAYESKPISETRILVVTKESATSTCTRSDYKELEEDHFSIVKPHNRESESYIWLVEQLTKKAAKKGWELDRWGNNEIILAGKDYPESNIHMAMIALILEDSFGDTFKVIRKYKNGDGRKVFNDLKNRDIDIYVEYSGSVLFGYLDNDPVDFKNKFNNDYKLLKKQHEKDELNKRIDIPGLNMVFYSQLGFDSPFQLIMNKENAKKLNLIVDDKVTLSNLIEKNNNCEILGETGFFHRKDGYLGLKKHYDHINKNFNFSIKYSSHVDTYDFFKKDITNQNCEYDQTQIDHQKCAVGVSYATDPELSEEFFKDKLIIIEDDKKFFPFHFPGVLAHSFLEKKFPEIKEVLSKKLKGIINIEEMVQLNRKGTAIWKKNESEFEKEIENIVRDFLIKNSVIKNTNRIESADISNNIGF